MSKIAKKLSNSPFRYPGGKFYARKLILACLPSHHKYCEPFAGGASIFFAKESVAENILNDKDEELMNCYRHIKDHLDSLIELLKDLNATKELHSYYKNEFQPANDLERAMRWYYLNRTSYSGIMKLENCYWRYGDKATSQKPLRGKMKATTASLASQPIACGC
nr:DNA adenine methylase [Microcystis aeruginosa]